MAPGDRGRGQRGPHRSSGSRGQASTSRGDYSSSKSKPLENSVPSEPRALRDTTNYHKPANPTYKGKNYDPNYKSKHSQDHSVKPPSEGALGIFERDRLENEAKRLQRATKDTLKGSGRGYATGSYNSKSLHFDDQKFERSSKSPAPENSNTPARESVMATNPNPFARKDASTSQSHTPTGLGSPSQVVAHLPSPTPNGFRVPSQAIPSTMGFGAPSANSPFGAPSQSASLNSPRTFGAPSQPASVFSTQSGAPSLAPSTASNSGSSFGAPSQPAPVNPFSFLGANSQPAFSNLTPSKPWAPASTSFTSANAFGNPSQFSTTQTPSLFNSTPQPTLPASKSSHGISTSGINVFAKPTNNGNSAIGALPPSKSSSTFGVPPAQTTSDAMATRAARFGTNAGTGTAAMGDRAKNGKKHVMKIPAPQIPQATSQPQVKATSPPDNSNRSSEALANKVNDVLRKGGIFPPKWPGWDFKDIRPVSQHERVKKYWNEYREYQGKVRSALIRSNLIDDPEVPKKLSDAIDFKGTCEEMCPEWERVDRIISGRVDDAEKEISRDGSLSQYPSLEKMVKALARSAAGQEAPLPDEVRSAAALRRTVDYLFGTVLANSDLPTVYTFLWDRTRAVRRDFVFHSFMNKSELHDQVDCLEKIVRFHVTAAHQMSQDGINTQGFSEQQELEQLGKSLLSLIHAYEDCGAQGIACENETEFRSYYILWGARSNPGILEEVQNWGWNLWESEEVQLAVSLVEALQTPWDALPLKPRAETDIAHNAFTRFFSTIEDKNVSYTMACFAETFFNHVRFSILRTILKAYRRGKDKVKGWTTTKLNEYLRFDDEEDVISFCESHGLHFDVAGEVDYLSFDSSTDVTQPSPPLKQGYSYNIVERKRGQYSLTDAINRSLYDETSEESDLVQDDEIDEEEDSLFVKGDSSSQSGVPPADNKGSFPGNTTHVSGWNFSVPDSSEEKVPLAAEIVTQPASIFDRIATPRTFNEMFTLPSPAASQPPTQTSSPMFQPQPSSETSTMFAKQPDKEIFPTSTRSAPTELSEKTRISKPASTFFVLQQSQAPIEIQSQLPETATPTAVPKAPTFFQQPPRAAPSFLSQLQPHDENPVPSSSSHTPQGSLAQSMPNKPPPFSGVTTPAPVASPLQTPGKSNAVEPRKEASMKPSEEEVLMISKIGSEANSRSSKLTTVSEWVTLGTDGLMEQFIASQVELILHDTPRMFMEEEVVRIAREAADRAAIEADSFRLRSLSMKYARKWRENARLLWLKRRGRIARQARRDLAESMRASKAARSASLVEDFRASTTSRRRGSLESLLDATGVLDGVHNSTDKIRTITHKYEPSPKRQRSERSISSAASSAMKRRRGQSEQQNPLRRSLLSDPTYLHGGSRTHLISDYDAKKESSPQISGVATDYFRLKARGITTLPDGTPLANSVTAHPVRKKRSVDCFVKPATPHHSKVAMAVQNVPVKRSRGFANSHDEIRVLKAYAKDVMAEDQMLRQKRAYLDDEEELFERAKRVREQMDEGASWYRQEIERETASRSVS